ncbi:hypothetical protein [Micromonospora maritima]|uniref:hypothetical protein n=1 Tax=Micromonospora maritima TaxID=986711 RepID=UPI00157D6881|nr:hypothetical protein [Micromonospora maritima]
MSMLLHLHAAFTSVQGVATDVIAAPDPGNIAPPGSDKILTILGWVKWIVTAVAVGGAMFIGAKMAIAHRRGDDTNTSALGWWLAGCVLLGVGPQLVDALT